MEGLKELIQVATKNKIKHLEILGIPSTKKTKVYELYEGIIDGRFQNDIEAAIHFYNKGPSHQSYLNLKSKLRKKLLNTILFLDTNPDDYQEYQKIMYAIPRKLAALNILISRGLYDTAIPILKKLLVQAQKIELTDTSIEILRKLRRYYGTINFNPTLYNQYESQLNQQLELLTKEIFVEGLFFKYNQNFLVKKGTKENQKEEANKYSNKLSGFISSSNTTKVIFYSSLIEIGKHMSLYHFKEVIKTSDLTISLLLQKEYVKPQGIIMILFQKIVCLIQLKEYQKGKKAVEELFTFLKEGKFNWYKGQEMKMYLLLHTKNYQEAYTTFSEAYTHKTFKKALAPAHQETWEIFKAYLHFLIELDFIQPTEGDTNFKKFRINRFLNTVPTYSKDKRGANIAILIIQIIFSIHQKKYDLMIDRIDAVNKYGSRHLRKGENFRSNCFIKMLLEIPKASFHKAAAERKAEPLVKKLSKASLEVANQTHSIEILPYEDLWPMVIGMLEMKRKWGER